MGPLKVARPCAPQAVFCLTDASRRRLGRRNHLRLTPYGRFLGGEDAVYVVASPLTVAAAAAAAGAGSRQPPIAHAVISEWTQMEFEVRAGLRESPLGATEHPETAAATAATAVAAQERSGVPQGAVPCSSDSSDLQIVPVACGEFLLFVQGFAVLMSTVMLIKNTVGAAVFESLEL